jgi:hypothetical protein
MHRISTFAAVLMLTMIFSSAMLAQDDSLETKKKKHWEDRWSEYMSHRSPAMGLSYGWGQSSLDGAKQSLYSPRTAELRLGGFRQVECDESPNVLDLKNDYAFLGLAQKDLGAKVNPGEINYTAWRAGFGWERGYGYALAGTADGPSISLLSSHAVQWTNIALKDGINNGPDSLLLGSYENGLRFGTRSAAIVRVHVLPMLAIDAGYERSVVYRRHQFWPWLGSAIIQGCGDAAVDRFVRRVLSSSPSAAPVVNFVLKNALSYGVYELRKKNGNWPFNSEAPMSNSAFTVGMTFVF